MGPSLRADPLYPNGEAEVPREETGKSTAGARRGMGSGTHTQTVEITSGRTTFQQGLAATCKDPAEERRQSRKEESGPAHEPIGARKAEQYRPRRTMSSPQSGVMPPLGKEALGKWRAWCTVIVWTLNQVAI